MLEPLVDVVDPDSVVTGNSSLLDIDLTGCTKADLAFDAPFRIVAQRDDLLHAFVAFFDCEFSCCRVPVSFSTGPHAPYTHWKQTVFYLDEPLSVTKGDEIKGSLRCAPNGGNPRDLDIKIEFEHAGKRAERSYRLR